MGGGIVTRIRYALMSVCMLCAYSNVRHSVLKLWKQCGDKMAPTAGLEGSPQLLLLLTCSVQARDGLLHHL